MTNQHIAECTYNKYSDPYCPVFKLEDILEEAEPNSNERELMMEKGGVVQIEIDWNCDYDKKDSCFPKYSFIRYDIPFSAVSAASGFNFRFANKFEINSTMYRTLVKAYGLRFIISVNGKAGKL